MSRHEVELSEFDFPIINQQELCGSYGGNTCKSLELVCEFDELNPPKATFVVKDHNMIRGQFFDIASAIKCYNSIE